MDNNMNFAYIATIYLGSPPQPIRCIFDTGSANAWVISKEAVDNKRYIVDKFQPYDKFASSTVEDPDKGDRQHAKITFGSGSLSGYFIKD